MKKQIAKLSALALGVAAAVGSSHIGAQVLPENQTTSPWYTDAQTRITEKLARTQLTFS